MKAILIVSHGSRELGAQGEFAKITQRLCEKLPNQLIETACLQFSQQTVEQGLDKLVEQGVRHIHILPYFLFDGVHTLENLPAVAAQYCAKHPQVAITIGKPLGADEKLVELLEQRIIGLN